jgi:hypothetical protein
MIMNPTISTARAINASNGISQPSSANPSPTSVPGRLPKTGPTCIPHCFSDPVVFSIPRHRRALTTAIYAKVDRDTLRTIARPWPGDAA